jgi:hypothetical protein
MPLRSDVLNAPYSQGRIHPGLNPGENMSITGSYFSHPVKDGIWGRKKLFFYLVRRYINSKAVFSIRLGMVYN